MAMVKHALIRWGPAFLWMAAIFMASSTPAVKLPRFGTLDYATKKLGHFVAYGLLALAYRRGLGSGGPRLLAAGSLAVIYALLDEYHQSFVPGRNPSLVDALLFDAGGALAALWASKRFAAKPRPAPLGNDDR